MPGVNWRVRIACQNRKSISAGGGELQPRNKDEETRYGIIAKRKKDKMNGRKETKRLQG